jgi:hypothetical protein
MKISENNEQRKFIWNFLELYSERFYAERNDDVAELDKVNKKIYELLPDYHYLFDDLNFLYKIYNEYFLENPNFILKDNFKSFMEWVFEELHEKKIVSKEVFEELKRFLVKFDIKSIDIGYGLAGGSVL